MISLFLRGVVNYFRSQPQLNYFWEKVELDDNGRIVNVLPLPNQARLADHNRVVQIPNVQLYDGGVYNCRVDRQNGGATSKTVQVMLQGNILYSNAPQ